MSGHIRPRTELRFNNRFGLAQPRYPRTDGGDTLSLRSRVGLGFDGRHFDGFFQLQHVSLWGATGGDQTNDPALGLHQAFMIWSPLSYWWLQTGRFEVAYGDERVLGAPGWNQTGRSWDGVRTGWFFNDDSGIDLFALYYDEGALRQADAFEGRAFEDDSLLLGAYLHGSKLSEWVTDADVYLLGDLQFDTLSDGPQRQVLAMIGGRLKNEIAVVEGGYQAGSRCVPSPPIDPATDPTFECEDESVGISAGFFDTEIGMKFGPARPFLGGGLATGDNPDTTGRNEAYFHMYPKAHKWMGAIDIIGPRTNVAEARVGLDLDFGKLKLRESIHYFTALRPTAQPAGIEFDTTVTYKVSDMFVAQAGHALFIPFDGTSLDPAESPVGLANWLFVQLSFDVNHTFE